MIVKLVVVIPRHRGGWSMFLTPPTLTEDFRKIDRGLFRKKSPPQAKNFWGPFFQKFDGFWKKIRKINGFLAVLTVFSGSTTKKSPPQAKNLGTPFFARRRRAKNFPRTFSFSSEDPPKKIWWRRMRWTYFISTIFKIFSSVICWNSRYCFEFLWHKI